MIDAAGHYFAPYDAAHALPLRVYAAAFHYATGA